MTDDTKRLLTVYIGECWHHWVIAHPDDHTTDYKMRGHKCYYCGEYWPTQPEQSGPICPRTFTTTADLHAVYGEMVRKGEWEEFQNSMVYKYREIEKDDYTRWFIAAFEKWLFCLSDPSQIGERMEMVAEWLRGRG